MLNFSPEEVVIGVMASFTYVTWMVRELNIKHHHYYHYHYNYSGPDRVLFP